MNKLTLAFWALTAIPTTLNASTIQSSVNSIINTVDPAINMSISVLDLNTGEHLFQRNADRTLIPASNMKLFSEAAALMALGPEYRFQRQISTDATALDSGTLKGSVYLSLPGDPSFTSANMNDLLSTLSEWGVQRITGNVVLVNANAAVDPYPPGRDPHDQSHSYGAPVAPIIIDENRVTLIVNPGRNANDPALVDVSAPAGVIAIDNTVKTSTKPIRSAIGYRLDMNNHLSASGAIGNGTWALEQRIPILNPLLYVQDLVKARLHSQNIALEGSVVSGTLPPNALVLASQSSEPLHQLMADTLKPSDNVFADSLFIHTASTINGGPVNWEQANTVAKKFLQQQTGINLTNAVLIDGSGLSKQDRVSAQQTVDLLRYIYSHFPITYEFIAALPISGTDGTLQRRFNTTSQQGFVRAKTGTMTGILSLSGYLSAANGHTLAFAIYINRKPKTSPDVAGRYHGLIDQLCSYFLQQKPNSQLVNLTQDPHSRLAFQQRPSPANTQRMKQARWRGLEMSLRKEVSGKMVSVVYKPNELIIQDNHPAITNVWNALAKINKKYSFAVALESQTAPEGVGDALRLLWIKSAAQTPGATRTWVLRQNLG